MCLIYLENSPVLLNQSITQRQICCTITIVIVLSRKEKNTETKAARVQIHESPKEASLNINTVNEKSPTTHKLPPLTMAESILNPFKGIDKNNRIENVKEWNEVVEEAETLYRIIYRNYGSYNENIVRLVLRENPKILNPRFIVVGQTITLSEIKR